MSGLFNCVKNSDKQSTKLFCYTKDYKKTIFAQVLKHSIIFKLVHTN